MSQSLEGLVSGLLEVKALLAANPNPARGLPRFDVLRAIGRSAVVLTNSHLEAYIYSLTSEMVDFLIKSGIDGTNLPLRIRLRHSSKPLEAAVDTSWEHRERALTALFQNEASLWTGGPCHDDLDPERLLSSLKTPRGKPLIRYFNDWGIDDIFSQITRLPTTRADLFLRIDELGEKRNLIAHGDLSVQATASDIRRFLAAVEKFGTRVDRVMNSRMQDLTGSKAW